MRALHCIALALAILTPALAAPVSMDVAPTTLEVKPGAVDLFYIANHSSEPVTVEIAPFDWRQDGGEDALAPSETLVASPQMAAIPAGGRQLVRVLAKAPGSYRLIVSQMADNSIRDPNAVRVLLRFGVPVFAGDGRKTPPKLNFRATHQRGDIDVAIRNDGEHPAKLAGLTLGGQKPRDDTFLYVLPGATRHVLFPGGASGALSARDERSDENVRADIAPLN